MSLDHIFYVLLFWTSRKDVDGTDSGGRKSERQLTLTSCLSYIPSENRIKIKLKNLWHWLVSCGLLPSCWFFIVPSTVYKIKRTKAVMERRKGRTRKGTTTTTATATATTTTCITVGREKKEATSQYPLQKRRGSVSSSHSTLNRLQLEAAFPSSVHGHVQTGPPWSLVTGQLVAGATHGQKGTAISRGL